MGLVWRPTFWRVQTLAILCATGLLGLIFYRRNCAAPIPWSISDRWANVTFAACCIDIFCAYAVLYGAKVLPCPAYSNRCLVITPRPRGS